MRKECLWYLMAAGLFLVLTAKPTLAENGIVIEEVGVGSALAEAGLEVEDVLSSWKRLPNPPANPESAAGTFQSPFDWQWIVVEQAPRGSVVLQGERRGEPRTWTVEPGLWEGKVRPRFAMAQEDDYRRGRDLVMAGDLEGGTAVWRATAEQIESELLRCWVYLQIGDALYTGQEWAKARIAYQEAMDVTRDSKAQAVIWAATGLIHKSQSEFGQAEASYRSEIEIYQGTLDSRLGVALGFLNLGLVAWEQQQYNTAGDFFHQALEIRQEEAPESLAVARSLSTIGAIASAQGRTDDAEKYYRLALEIRERLAPHSLAIANSLYNLGNVAMRRGQQDDAVASFQRALEIRESLAPQSLEVATSLTRLARIAQTKGQLEDAARSYGRALAIRRKLVPQGRHVASSLLDLAGLASVRGALATSSKYAEEALRIQTALDPGGLDVARSLSQLGVIAGMRGDLDVATEYFQRALKIRQALTLDDYDIARTLNQLGVVAGIRGDFTSATNYLQKSTETWQVVAPDSLNLAATLNNLGNVFRDQGRFDVAEAHYQQSLALKQALAPGSHLVAKSLHNWATLAEHQGQLEVAATRFQQALALKEKLVPGSLSLADSLTNLGVVTYKRGQLETAARYSQQALALQEKLAPDSLNMAINLNNLGQVAADQSQAEVATDYFERSLSALEAQVSKLGGSQLTKSSFRAHYQNLYNDYIDYLLKREELEQAFAALERARAQGFLAMLKERDIIFSEIPEELNLKRRYLSAQLDQTMRKAASLNEVEDQESISSLHTQLTSLYQEWDNLRAEIRRESPHLANLQYPQPFDYPKTQSALDPGTVMLSYHVSEAQTDLFVITPDRPLAVHTLDIDKSTLQENVEDFRRLIDASQNPGALGKIRRVGLLRAAKNLYDLLVAPAQEAIDASERILLVPDGPLHLLPFPALVHDPGEETGKGPRYLIESKPLHTVLSATVYAEILQGRRPSPSRDESSTRTDGPLLAAFGDPHYSLNDGSQESYGLQDARVRSAREQCGFAVDRLPASRREVLEISSLFRNVRTHLGEGAREEALKALDADTRILHLAAHACLDDRLPLSSGLFLTLPKGFPEHREDGLLQTWEIFESVRLEADLVVLSACGTSLGQEQGGEGLIGLTRAFQYAGARTVAATLWQVDDLVTAELMVRFYRHLQAGKTKDAALQAAQVELIQAPIDVRGADGQTRQLDASSPYFWAAFQIHGDWQ